jgi:hypothetical protein
MSERVTGSGLSIPEWCVPGQRVYFFDELKRKIMTADIISTGEGVAVLNVHRGQIGKIVRWEALSPDPEKVVRP